MALSFFFQAEDGIRDYDVTGVQTCALPICKGDEAAAEAVLASVPEGLADEAFVEGPSYYRRLRMYRGELAPEDLLAPDKGSQVIHDVETIYATQGYGVGNWYLYNGETDRARAVFDQILQGRSRFAFGYIAAELDLREMAEG